MTNEEQKLRGFATKQFPLSKELKKEVLYNLIQQAKQDECLSDLTALISEHYYPKEFVEWLLVNAEIVEYKGVNMWKVYLAGFMSHPYFTTDELYKIRKENER